MDHGQQQDHCIIIVDALVSERVFSSSSIFEPTKKAKKAILPWELRRPKLLFRLGTVFVLVDAIVSERVFSSSSIVEPEKKAKKK